MGWGDETLKAYLLESDEESGDLLLYLHGYNSCMSQGESRPLHIHSMGVNVISLDQKVIHDIVVSTPATDLLRELRDLDTQRQHG